MMNIRVKEYIISLNYYYEIIINDRLVLLSIETSKKYVDYTTLMNLYSNNLVLQKYINQILLDKYY